MEVVFCLVTFNTSCMRSKIRCDGTLVKFWNFESN